MIPPRTIRILLFLATIFFLIGSNPLPEAVVYAQSCSSDAECDDGFDCTVDTCESGMCVNTPGVCLSGSPCDINGMCDPGDPGARPDGCVYESLPCDDGVDCTSDFCPPLGAGCVSIPSSAICDDSNVCTNDTCSPGGGRRRSHNRLRHHAQ